MWWIALMALACLLIGAVGVTFVVMVALNGFMRLPDGFVSIYLGVTGVYVLALSLLSGHLGKRYAELKSQPLGVGGLLATAGSVAILPFLACGLTAVLLVAFGMI